MSFNPFIQVFYFYELQSRLTIGTLESNVLIPLFRSFIFTLEVDEKTESLKLSFNPFIQVFYFYT